MPPLSESVAHPVPTPRSSAASWPCRQPHTLPHGDYFYRIVDSPLVGCFVPLLVRYITLSYLNCRDAALHMFITTSALSSCSHVFGTQYLRVYTCLEAMPDRRWRTRGSTTFYRIITPRDEERGQIPYVTVEASLRRPVCTSLGCDFAKLPEGRLTRSQKQDNTDVNIHEGRVFNTRRQWTMPRGKQVLLIGAASCVITAPQLEAG